MARRRRTDEQHGWFHVWNRGVDRQDIFIDDRDRQRFVELVGEAAEEFGVEVHAFSLMSNHFHLVVHCPDGMLSAFAQRVQKRYVEYHNRRVDRVGPLFTGRFSATLLNDESSNQDADDVLKVMVRYVHRNPLDRMPMSCLELDPFSSYGAYLGRTTTPAWLRTDVVVHLHGDRRRLRAFTEQAHQSDTTPEFGRVVDPYELAAILRSVGEEFRVETDAMLRPSNHRRTPIRDLAAHLCVALRVAPVDELAHEFHVSARAFRRCAARGKDRCGADTQWASHRASVLARLSRIGDTSI